MRGCGCAKEVAANRKIQDQDLRIFMAAYLRQRCFSLRCLECLDSGTESFK